MSDAFITGVLVAFGFVFLFIIPAAIGVGEGDDKGQRSILTDWCAGVFILATIVTIMAMFSAIILGLGYLTLWLV